MRVYYLLQRNQSDSFICFSVLWKADTGGGTDAKHGRERGGKEDIDTNSVGTKFDPG